MNRINTITVAVLVAALPFAPAAFASDRDDDDDYYRRPAHSRHYDNDHNWGHEHHHNRYCGHRGYGHHDGYNHYENYDRHGQNNYRAQVVLPFPPLPPFPVIILNKKHNGGHVELRRPY